MSARMARILATLDRQVHAFDLDRDRLGERAMDLAVDSILADMDAQRAPDGSSWPGLSAGYAKHKARVAPGKPMAVLHEKMKDRAQLEGERVIGPHHARMTYGKDAQAKQEAAWFQEGPPERRFYGLSAEATRRQDDFFARRLKEVSK